MTQQAGVTMEELRQFLGVDMPPTASRPVLHDTLLTRVSAINTATPDAIVFAADPGSLDDALGSRAGVILVPTSVWAGHEDSEQPGRTDPRVIAVADPRTAFSLVYQRWFRPAPRSLIHPSATVERGARLGRLVSIGAGAVVERNCVLGDECVVGPRVVILSGTTLGRRVRVQAGAVLGGDGFGYARTPECYVGFPQVGALVIEDDVEIGANTTIDRGALGETRIGHGTKIDNLVHIAHNCVLGRNVIVAAQAGLAGSTTVEDDVMLGGQVGLGEHVTIGRGSILGGQSGVLSGKDFRGKPGEVYFGTPARPVRQFMREMARLARGR